MKVKKAHTGAKTQHIESPAAVSRLSTQNACRSNRQKLIIAWKTQAPRASKLKHRNNPIAFSSAASAAPPPCQIESGRPLRFRCAEHGKAQILTSTVPSVDGMSSLYGSERLVLMALGPFLSFH